MATRDDSRAAAEARFAKARKTTDEANAVIDAERVATREKTARLKALRLAKEAADSAAKSTKKPPRPKKGAAPARPK